MQYNNGSRSVKLEMCVAELQALRILLVSNCSRNGKVASLLEEQ